MAYPTLEQHFHRISQFEHLQAVASWDEAAMMPIGGGTARAEALAALRVLIHEQTTAPLVGELIDRAQGEAAQLSPWQAANLREIARGYRRATALPTALVQAASLAESKSEQAWRRLRAANDWAAFCPLLTEVVSLRREMASALGDALGLSPYDALLDGFEPGVTTAQIVPIFADLERALPELVQLALAQQPEPTSAALLGPFSVSHQKELSLRLMRQVGFNFDHGRLDTSHHPFCGGVPEDVRITTRYDVSSLLPALMGVFHETGHAKYEQHLPRPWLHQPVGRARSMAVHESQSLLLEMQVCRNPRFAEYLAPEIERTFPGAFGGVTGKAAVETLRRALIRVRPGFIRVDADEVTYPCHVLLRFELEQELMRGALRVSDLPDRWDAGMQRLLGLSTKGNYRDGCMQDVHWPAGLFGYFPTYTLGALLAAQLFAAARLSLPELEADLSQGKLSTLDQWLDSQVWSQGSLLDTPALVLKATGSPLNAGPLLRHLRQRYVTDLAAAELS